MSLSTRAVTDSSSTTAPFFSSNQPSGHNLPGIAGLNQSSQASAAQPSQRGASAGQEPAAGPQSHQSTSHGPGYSLPGIGQAMQSQQLGQSAQGNNDRERDMRDERHAEELAIQGEQREREMRERQQIEQAAHENHAGSIHLHQPVAVNPQVRAIHGPNGILGNSSQVAPSSISSALSGPNGPAALFGSGPGQQGGERAANLQQHPTQATQQGLMVPFGGPPGMQQSLAMGQGQQPILNVGGPSFADDIILRQATGTDIACLGRTKLPGPGESAVSRAPGRLQQVP